MLKPTPWLCPLSQPRPRREATPSPHVPPTRAAGAQKLPGCVLAGTPAPRAAPPSPPPYCRQRGAAAARARETRSTHSSRSAEPTGEVRRPKEGGCWCMLIEGSMPSSMGSLTYGSTTVSSLSGCQIAVRGRWTSVGGGRASVGDLQTHHEQRDRDLSKVEGSQGWMGTVRAQTIGSIWRKKSAGFARKRRGRAPVGSQLAMH